MEQTSRGVSLSCMPFVDPLPSLCLARFFRNPPFLSLSLYLLFSLSTHVHIRPSFSMILSLSCLNPASLSPICCLLSLPIIMSLSCLLIYSFSVKKHSSIYLSPLSARFSLKSLPIWSSLSLYLSVYQTISLSVQLFSLSLSLTAALSRSTAHPFTQSSPSL